MEIWVAATTHQEFPRAQSSRLPARRQLRDYIPFWLGNRTLPETLQAFRWGLSLVIYVEFPLFEPVWKVQGMMLQQRMDRDL